MKKDINPQIYERYTQSSNKVVLENLKLLATSGYAEKMLVRIPLINGYNKQDDIQKSKSFLEDMGYSAFDLFEYKTDNSYEG